MRALTFALLIVPACSASTTGALGPADAPAGSDAPVGLGKDAPVVPDALAGKADAPVTARPDAPVIPSPDAPVTAGCGPCPTGFHCGSTNGLAVCRNDQTNIPLFTHVFVIVMENLSYSTLTDSDNASASPFLHGLMTSGAYSSRYHGVTHPSLPNYIALTSGDSHGIGCDCAPTGDDGCNALRCNTLIGACNCSQAALNVADQLESAGKSWRAYGEDMGLDTPCNLDDAGKYAVRHVPFLYYQDIQSNGDRCATHVVDYMNLGFDSPGDVPVFSFIAPNLTHDMHDPILPGGRTNIANGDSWLQSTGVPTIVGLDAYKQGGLLVIVWDEDDYSGIFDGDDPIPLFVLSPYAKVQYQSTVTANHYSLLATFEDGLNLPRLGHAADAQPLADFFPDQ